MNKIQSLSFMALVLFSIACESQELTALKKATEEIKQKNVPASYHAFSFVEPQFSYQAMHLRSPFAENADKEELVLSENALRRTVGKIEKNGEIWRLVEDEKGAIHVVLEKK